MRRIGITLPPAGPRGHPGHHLGTIVRGTIIMRSRHSALLVLVFGTLAASLLSAAPALADARQDVMSAAQRCAGIADDRTWLDCFYGSAQPMRTRLGLSPAPASQTQLVPASGPADVPPAQARPVAGPPPPMPEAPSGFGHLFGGKPLVSNVRM